MVGSINTHTLTKEGSSAACSEAELNMSDDGYAGRAGYDWRDIIVA